MNEILTKHFATPERIVNNLYCAGTLMPGSYGYISGGYGGGCDVDQYNDLLWLSGYMMGIMSENQVEGRAIMRALNEELKKKDSSIQDSQLPFKTEN